MIRNVLAAAGAAAVAAVLAGGGAAHAAAVTSWSDTSLQANPPSSTGAVALGTPSSVAGSFTVPVTCSGAYISGQPLSVSPAAQGGLAAAFSAASPVCDSATLDVSSPGPLTDGTYTFDVTASPAPAHNATETAVLVVTVSGTTPAVEQVYDQSVTLTSPPDSVYPDIQFSGTTTLNCAGYADEPLAGGQPSDPCGYVSEAAQTTSAGTLSGSWAAADLPSGLGFAPGSGGLLVPGTAVPGTYSWATVSGSAASGAAASETFQLTVQGAQVSTYVPGNYGDEVNGFGNGFDVWQQRWQADTVIAGWTATEGDPATHFIRAAEGAGWRFEAALPDGAATGLCVSNPDGGYAGDPAGPYGLVLRGCNHSMFQEFTAGAGGELVSAANGQLVVPDGTGAQLRTATAAPAWGGASYAWQDYSQLPQ